MSRGYARPNTRGSLLKKDEDLSEAQVQNVKKSRVYVFGDADIEEDEIVEYEMSEMRSRNKRRKQKKEKEKPLFFDRKITDGDTLQSLSLQFGCPVCNNYWLSAISLPILGNFQCSIHRHIVFCVQYNYTLIIFPKTTKDDTVYYTNVA